MMYTDPDGEWFWLAAMAVGAIAGGWGKDLSKTDTWRDIAFGAAVGAAAGAGLQWAGGQLGLTVNLGFKYEGFGEITLASTDTGAATVFSGVVGVVGSAMSSMFPERKNYSSYDDYMADSMGDAYYPGIPVLACNGCDEMAMMREYFAQEAYGTVDQAGLFLKNSGIDLVNHGIDFVNVMGPVNLVYGGALVGAVYSGQYQMLPGIHKAYDFVNREPLQSKVTIPKIQKRKL